MPSDPSTLALLKTRRSAKLRSLIEPGPTPAQLDELLTIAARVPDHGKLVPWRFILIHGAARQPFSDLAAAAQLAADPATPAVKLEETRTRFAAIPLTVVVVSSPREHPNIPKFEQELSAGAVCMNLLVAAKAMGFAATWFTEWYATSPAILAALKTTTAERIAGFIYIGTEPEPREDRPRPTLAQITTTFTR